MIRKQPFLDEREASRVRTRWLALLVLWLLVLASCSRREVSKPNVLLITLDTFRADRIGPETPNLQRLVAKGIRFENADSPVPLTLPAHASLLSGLLPIHHGVRTNGAISFPENRDTLATVFSRAGYRTGAFVSAFVLDHRFGLQRGFEVYDDEVPRDASDEANALEAERRGGDTVDRALAWLGRSDARPFFAWVHLYDAHASYTPPPPYPQTYDGEIAYVDAQVGRLLAAVDETKTVIIAVGDHGEALGEHGELTHGLLLYEPTLHVPWIITTPAGAHAVVRQPVSSVDLAPTVAALAHLPWIAGDGHDLSAAVRREGQAPINDLYAETEYPLQFGWSDLTSIRRGDQKYIASSQPELFDLANDPAEKVNVLTTDRRHFHILDATLAAMRKSAVAVSTPVTVDEETRAKLASLGYIAPTGSAAQSGPRPNPETMAPIFRRFEEAVWALNGGHPQEALAKLGSLVKDDPANPVFRETLARSLRQQGQLEPAIRLYREAVAIAPERAEGWYNLSVALQEAGHVQEGEVAIREAVRRDAGRPEAHNALGLVEAAGGRLPAAEAEFRRVIALDPRNARGYNNLGNVLRSMNRPDEARQAYEQAVALAPGYADPLNGIGVLDVQGDRPRDALARFDAALRIAPDFYEAQLNRGIALDMSGDKTAAAEQFRQLLAHLPKGPQFDDQRNAAKALLARR